jgi:hypothetical protein
MVAEPSHVKQLSLNHVCKIGLKVENPRVNSNSEAEAQQISQTLPINRKQRKLYQMDAAGIAEGTEQPDYDVLNVGGLIGIGRPIVSVLNFKFFS